MDDILLRRLIDQYGHRLRLHILGKGFATLQKRADLFDLAKQLFAPLQGGQDNVTHSNPHS